MLCLVTIFTFFLFWSHRGCRPLSRPPFRSSSYSRHPTGPHLAGPVCFVSSCPGLVSSTLATYRSGIRWYTAFCQQFGLTPLPLSDFNLCRFVSYLHQQQLSSASVRLYLAVLQIVAVGHDPQPGEFPRWQYAVRAGSPQACPGHSGYLSPRPFFGHCIGGGPHPWCHIGIICCGLPALLVFSPFCGLGSSPAHCQLPTTPQCCHGATSRLTATIILLT